MIAADGYGESAWQGAGVAAGSPTEFAVELSFGCEDASVCDAFDEDDVCQVRAKLYWRGQADGSGFG